MAVLQYTKRLDAPTAVAPINGVRLRNYESRDDIPLWLELRRRAFARETLGVRAWDIEDFERELLDKNWWRPERLWFAESDSSPSVLRGPRVVGAVAVAERGAGEPAVHWLMVDPAWRRRGVGQLLLATLEARCWQAGARQIWLETHSAWASANRLYQRAGYIAP